MGETLGGERDAPYLDCDHSFTMFIHVRTYQIIHFEHVQVSVYPNRADKEIKTWTRAPRTKMGPI